VIYSKLANAALDGRFNMRPLLRHIFMIFEAPPPTWCTEPEGRVVEVLPDGALNATIGSVQNT